MLYYRGLMQPKKSVYVGAESEQRDRRICTRNLWLRNTVFSADTAGADDMNQ